LTAQEAVILVHGLWMHGAVMALMRRRIERCGYRAVSYSYPSMRLTLTENALRLAQFCRDMNAARVNFVAHSMGGLVVLRMLGHAAGIGIGRVVLAGTPCAESFAALRMVRHLAGRAALGRSILEWRAHDRGGDLGRFEIGVIAGNLSVGLGRLIAPDLPAPNDGVVSVAETRLPEMRDSIVLKVSHSGMLVSRAVVRQACEFLRHGAFAHAEGVTSER
jgi:pimeloyl-ACP methyl ester carboxylesterase